MPAKFTYIDTAEKLDAAFAESYERPVALLKHSNICGISAHVMFQMDETDADVYVIVIQENRPLSDLVAKRTSRRHQSPQAFVLKNGTPIYHATHYAIDARTIAELLK